jgi:hypothetical protein
MCVYTAKVAGNGEEAKLVQPETHPCFFELRGVLNTRSARFDSIFAAAVIYFHF